MHENLTLHDGSHGTIIPGVGETVVNINDEIVQPLDREWRAVRFLLREGASLQGIMAWARLCGRTARFHIGLRARVPGTILHSPGSLVDGRSVLELERRETDDYTHVTLRLAWRAPVWSIMSSCLAAPAGRNHLGRDGFRVGVPLHESGAWAGLSPHNMFSDGFVDAEQDPDNPGPTPRMDFSYTGHHAPPATKATSHIRIEVQSPIQGRWRYSESSAAAKIPPVETRIFNPIGARLAPSKGTAYLSPFRERSLVIRDESGSFIDSPANQLGDRAIRRLRDYTHLVDAGSAHFDLISRAEFLTRALAAGVQVVSSDTKSLRSILETEIVDLIHEETPSSFPNELETRIAQQVRVVHRWNSTKLFPRLTAAIASPQAESVSVIISTKRPEFVEHAIKQFETQSWEKRELLLGFHGFSLRDLDNRVADHASRHARVFEFEGNHLFGDVLRRLTLASDGDVIAKMDDDDWYSQYHLEDLVYALRYSNAQLVGSGVQFVYMHNSNQTLRRAPEIGYKYGGHPGGPTFCSPREVVLDAGNWPLTTRAVDTGLNQAIVEIGGSVFQSHPLNFVFNKRSSGHTWRATNEYFMSRVGQSWNGLHLPPGFDAPVDVPEGWLSSPARLGHYDGRLTEALRALDGNKGPSVRARYSGALTAH